MIPIGTMDLSLIRLVDFASYDLLTLKLCWSVPALHYTQLT